MRIALGVEYDGTAFSGWQVQLGQRTVQGAVEKALSVVANETVVVHCAGRTDTGVHATWQVVHFDTSAERRTHQWVMGANSNLPSDVSVIWAKACPDNFHARFSALSRRYQYVIFNRQYRPGLWHSKVSWEYQPLDFLPMSEAARHLVGRHDFSAFRASGCQAKSPVREVHSCEVRASGRQIVIDVHANAFLQHMVRNIAGVLIAIGAGTRPVEWAREVLESRDRKLAAMTASPHGLYLCDVQYPSEFGLPNSPDFHVGQEACQFVGLP